MKSTLKRHTCVFAYGHNAVSFHFWTRSDEEKAIDCVIFLGTSQAGRLARWAAMNAPAGTAVVDGLPHHVADQDAHDLKEFTLIYTETAFREVLRQSKIEKAHIIAESQAAPGVVWLARDHPESIGNIALIDPLGFTAHILGDTPKGRLRELRRRSLSSALQFARSPFYDWRNLYLNPLMMGVLLHDARWKVSGQKYAKGASYDLRDDFREVTRELHGKRSTMTLLLGEKDKIFPAHEIVSALKEAGVVGFKTIILRTSHTSLATRDGKQLLAMAARAVRGH